MADLHWLLKDVTELERAVREFMLGKYDCILIRGFNKEDTGRLKEYAQRRWPHVPFICSYLVFQMDADLDEQIYYVVHFHADGGVTCLQGRRVFTDPGAALEFADKMRAEPDHICGPRSVRIETTHEDPGDEGEFYPAVVAAR